MENEKKIIEGPQDKLQRSFSLWVMVKDQVYQNKQGAYDESDLQEITSFDSVSIIELDNQLLF
ncbi:MAG: hypothetical protein ACK55Z_15045 [bacterium]